MLFLDHYSDWLDYFVTVECIIAALHFTKLRVLVNRSINFTEDSTEVVP